MKIPVQQLQPNMLPLGTYNLTVTGTNWTTVKSSCTVYKNLSNKYYVDIILTGTTTSLSSINLTATGLTFATYGANSQVGISTNNVVTSLGYVLASDGASTLAVGAGSNGTTWSIHVYAELASKPTWLES